MSIKNVLRMVHDKGMLLLFLMCSATALASYGMALWGQFPACRLCHIQRMIVLCLAGSTGICLCIKNKGYLLRFFSYGIMMLWVIGAVTSLYHVGIQYHLLSMPQFCIVDNASTLDALLMAPHASCNQRTLDIGGIPASVYLFFMFIFGACYTYFLTQKSLDR